MSRDAYASRLRLVFLSTLRSCSSRFLRALKKNNKNNDNKQKFIVIVKTNIKAFEIINFYLYSCVHLQYIQVCMCKRVIRACSYKEHLRDICRGMFCIRQYLSKKEKKEKRIKNGICFFYSKVIHVHLHEKSGILICNFLVSCNSQVGPVSQTAIFQICSRWYSKGYLKHTL